MFDWRETRNGNFVCEDDDSVTITVFLDKADQWRGIRDEHITALGYPSADAAINAIERGRVEFLKIRSGASNTDWKPAKKGGYYRYRNGQILATKQSSRGYWYMTVDGSLIRDKWFMSFDAAARYADSLMP